MPSGYPKPFCFDLGQRNAELVSGPLVRGARLLPWLDAVTVNRAGGCDLLHTLNAVPVATRKPYIVTFESYLPRVPDDRYMPWLERLLFNRLARPQCRRIIAFTEYALGLFKAQIARYPSMERLLEKTEVLYPAVAPQATMPKEPPSGHLRLLYVGRQFMHKGGPAAVRAHEGLTKAGIPVETTIISNLEWDAKGLVGPTSAELVKEEKARLNQQRITHHTSLSNEQVRRLMAETDFLMLPTVNDTFGFVCLEAMTAGTPVIASRTCALPEIVQDGVTGYLLDMPNDPIGRWTGLKKRRTSDYDRLYVELIDSLAAQTVNKLVAFWANRTVYRALSAGAIDAVHTRFNRATARDRLEQIYEAALL